MDVFQALADPVRRELLRSLAHGQARVVDLAAPQPVSRPAISKHLRVLTQSGLAEAESHGRERHYSLNADGLAPLHQLLADLTRHPPVLGEDSLDALDLEVRRTVRDHRSLPPDVSQETA